jgi:hypothetical protein
MAKPTRIILSGKIENLIFYEFRGKPCVRKAPTKVRQTKATKASAKLFGMAVSMSAELRKALAKILPAKAKHKYMYRLNTVLLKWLKEERPKTPAPSNAFSALHDFSFNEDCSLHSYLRRSVMVDWSKTGPVVVRIPALTPAKDLRAPAKTQSVIWRITIASCAVDNPSAAGQQAFAEVEMPYENDPVGARSIELPFSLSRGDLAVVVISLQYRVAKSDWTSLLTNSKWLPVDIVDAAYW